MINLCMIYGLTSNAHYHTLYLHEQFYNIHIMKHNSEDQLQISEFIKDPATLKLLILAGTNIRTSQLTTISKCTGLIKLDLSSNSLIDIPLKFSHFSQLKILYLHDNKIADITISKTNVEYISLFDNPIKEYRKMLIDNNDKLIGIDYNIVTRKERYMHSEPMPYSKITWPIVQISHNLEKQEDYLNLLKAEIFVVNNVQKKTIFIENIHSYIHGLLDKNQFIRKKSQITDELFFKRDFILKATRHWITYTIKKRKLRQILKQNNKEYLIYNKLQRNRAKRSPQVDRIVTKFVDSVRRQLAARQIVQKNIAGFRRFIPVNKQMNHHYLTSCKQTQVQHLYFKKSEFFNLQKIFLFAKRLLFKDRKFDLCDDFDKLIRKTGKQHYIFRKKDKQHNKCFLKNVISQTISMVLSQKGIDRRHFLYNKKGHRKIQIKSLTKKMKQAEVITFKKQKLYPLDQRINKIYNSYQILLEYQIKSQQLYLMLLKLIRYFNSGNSDIILSNQAAYFQTEVLFDTQSKPATQYIYAGLEFYVRRVMAANKIQRFWRRVQSKKQSNTNIIQTIRKNRSQKLIQHFILNLTYSHRLILNKYHSFLKSIWRESELYIHLDIYMNLPQPTDLLRYKRNFIKEMASNQQLYQYLHYKTQIEIMDFNGRKWIKIHFSNSKDAYNAYKQFSIQTYKYYYNGFYIKLFSAQEIQNSSLLIEYERKVQHLYKIAVIVNKSKLDDKKVSTKIQIQNAQPYFIWSQQAQFKYQNLFPTQQLKMLPISIFIYNKSKRPLKVSCDLLWTTSNSLYSFRKKAKSQIRIKQPLKHPISNESQLQQYLPHLKFMMEKGRKNSMKQHRSLLGSNRKRGLSDHTTLSLLSQTLNIKRK